MTEKTKSKRVSDGRHKPLIDFAYQTYEEKYHHKLVVDGRGVKSISEMLKATKGADEYSLENLKRYWIYFLGHADKFDRKQPPLYWFASHIQRWNEESSKNGSGSEVAKEWIKKRLQQ